MLLDNYHEFIEKQNKKQKGVCHCLRVENSWAIKVGHQLRVANKSQISTFLMVSFLSFRLSLTFYTIFHFIQVDSYV